MSAAHVNTSADNTPQVSAASARSMRSDVLAAAGQAFNAAVFALAERCLR